MVAPRAKRPTEPAPVTGPIFSKEMQAVRQEIRVQTIAIVLVLLLGIVLIQG